MSKSRQHRERGSTLLFTVSISAIILFIVAAVLSYASHERVRASNDARMSQRFSCVETGLQMARAYFGDPDRYLTSQHWNLFLQRPWYYNPVITSWNPTLGDDAACTTAITGTNPPATNRAANPFGACLKTNHPELFADLDGDGVPDVYIYIRDNADERAPAANDWTTDNDQTAIIGAVCISTTMVPKPDGKAPTVVTTNNVNLRNIYPSIEGVLQFNTLYGPSSQANAGNGSGNVN
jgi:hypothetical protein